MAVSATNPHTQKTFHSHLLAVSARTVGIHCPVVRTYTIRVAVLVYSSNIRLTECTIFSIKKTFFIITLRLRIPKICVQVCEYLVFFIITHYILSLSFVNLHLGHLL